MTTNRQQICIFAGSGTPSDPAIMAAAQKLGTQLGEGGYDLVYGGGTGGVMGAVAQAACAAGADVTAVTLEKYSHETQIDGAKVHTVVTEAERFKYFSASAPAAYFVLPGGPGSLREALQGLEEAVYGTGAPVILVKVGAYLDGIKQYFDLAVAAGMIKADKKDCLKIWSVDKGLDTVLASAASKLDDQRGEYLWLRTPHPSAKKL